MANRVQQLDIEKAELMNNAGNRNSVLDSRDHYDELAELEGQANPAQQIEDLEDEVRIL